MKIKILRKYLVFAIFLFFIGFGIQPCIALNKEGGNNPPEKPWIEGPTKGEPNVEYTYYFTAIDPDGDPVSFFIDWGDGTNTGWTTTFIPSGDYIWYSHTWNRTGWFDIRAKARDLNFEEGEWSEPLTITIPRTRTSTFSFHWLYSRFPTLERMLTLLL